MKKLALLTSGIALCAGMAVANDNLISEMSDPAQWAIPIRRPDGSQREAATRSEKASAKRRVRSPGEKAISPTATTGDTSLSVESATTSSADRTVPALT